MGSVANCRNPTISAAIVISVALGAACGSSPTAPVPIPDSTPTPTPVDPGYRIFGLVTDENGTPVPNASILVDHGPDLPDIHGSTVRVTASTRADGSYEIVLRTDQIQAYNPFAMIRVSARGFNETIQLLERGLTGSLRNIRLRRVRTLDSGQGLLMTIEHDSSLCDITDVTISSTRICERVRINAPGSGVTVEVRDEAGVLVVPSVQIGRLAPGQGTLKLDLGCSTNPYIDIPIGIPVGTAPQRVWVGASTRPLPPECVEE